MSNTVYICFNPAEAGKKNMSDGCAFVTPTPWVRKETFLEGVAPSATLKRMAGA